MPFCPIIAILMRPPSPPRAPAGPRERRGCRHPPLRFQCLAQPLAQPAPGVLRHLGRHGQPARQPAGRARAQRLREPLEPRDHDPGRERREAAQPERRAQHREPRRQVGRELHVAAAAGGHGVEARVRGLEHRREVGRLGPREQPALAPPGERARDRARDQQAEALARQRRHDAVHEPGERRAVVRVRPSPRRAPRTRARPGQGPRAPARAPRGPAGGPRSRRSRWG